jgi:cytoskeletal protein RodZ
MSDHIGQQLREERESRSLSLEQVSQATHIRVHYLQAMESGNLDAIPSKAQARGFLRAYAEYLKLDISNLLPKLDTSEIPKVKKSPKKLSKAETKELPEKSSGQYEHADLIFVEVGESLQKQRKLLGLSLDDVERHTHLRQRYLNALETGNLGDLPSPVQGRGMLKNYANFLGLNSDQVLLRFAEGLQVQHAARKEVRRSKAPLSNAGESRGISPFRRLFSSDILIGGTFSLLLVVFVVWGAIRIFAMETDQEPTPTAPSIADVLLAPPTSTMTSTLEPATATVPLDAVVFPTQEQFAGVDENIFPAGVGTGVQINIAVHQRAWMRVVADEEIVFDGRVIPGSAYTYSGEEQVEVLTGNGAALQVYLNQQDLGLLGFFGEVVHRIYRNEGILEPTATITNTPTETLPATNTPAVTPTAVEATVPPSP